MPDSQWSSVEQEIAHQLLAKAYQRETTALMSEVREQANNITEISQIWALHDYLSTKRYDIDGKYDERDTAPFFTLAKLVKQGWLDLDELAGLSPDKKAKVSALTKMQQ
jgi:hypothetical protein